MQLVYDPGEEAPAFTTSEKGKGRGEPVSEKAEYFGGGASSSEVGECNEKTVKWIQEQSDFEMAKRLQREFDQEGTDPPSRPGTTTLPLVTQPADQRPPHVTASSQASGSSTSPSSETTPRDLQRAGLTQLRFLDLQESCGPWCFGECNKLYLHLYGTDVTSHAIWNLWNTGAGSSNRSATVDSLGDSEGWGNDSSKEMQASDLEIAKSLQKEFDEEADNTASNAGDETSEDSPLPSDNQTQGHEANNPEPPRLRHIPAYSSPLRLGYYSADEDTYTSTEASEQGPSSLKQNAKRRMWSLKKLGPSVGRQLLLALGFVATHLYKMSREGCICEYERDEFLGEPEIFSTIPRVTLKGLPNVIEKCDFCSDKDFEISRQLEYSGDPDIPDDDTVVGGGDDQSDNEEGEDDDEGKEGKEASPKRFPRKILSKLCALVSSSNMLCMLQRDIKRVILVTKLWVIRKM